MGGAELDVVVVVDADAAVVVGDEVVVVFTGAELVVVADVVVVEEDGAEVVAGLFTFVVVVVVAEATVVVGATVVVVGATTPVCDRLVAALFCVAGVGFSRMYAKRSTTKAIARITVERLGLLDQRLRSLMRGHWRSAMPGRSGALGSARWLDRARGARRCPR